MDATRLSDSFAHAIATAAPIAVGIDAGRRAPASGAIFDDGVVVAAWHTLERESDIDVVLADDTRVPASLAGADPSTDLAVLRVPGVSAPAWADTDTLAVGHLVFAVARPGRLHATVGIASSVGGGWRTSGGGRVDRYVETTLGPWPGFSGSVLADAVGRVIGVNSSGLSRRRSLALPTATVRRVVTEILTHGRTRRAFLGIGTHPVRLTGAHGERAGQPAGLLLVSLQPEGPADRAGLLLGDIVLALDGTPVGRPDELVALLDADHIDRPSTLRILRAGAPLDVTFTLGSR